LHHLVIVHKRKGGQRQVASLIADVLSESNDNNAEKEKKRIFFMFSLYFVALIYLRSANSKRIGTDDLQK